MSDEQLWRAAVGGDPSAFGELFARHADRVFAYCHRRLPRLHDAEDATAQVFMTAWTHGHKIHFVDGSALPWLLVVATNVIHKIVRHARREERRVAQLGATLRGRSEEDVADGVAARDQQSRARSMLNQALADLSARDRTIVGLCDLGGLSHREAAEALGVPLGTVKSRLSRAHARMRRHLHEQAAAPNGASPRLAGDELGFTATSGPAKGTS